MMTQFMNMKQPNCAVKTTQFNLIGDLIDY